MIGLCHRHTLRLYLEPRDSCTQLAEIDAGQTDTMSDKAMVDQVLTFLAAGHETTASGLSWTLWLLANDPESQRKLREEVNNDVLGASLSRNGK